MKSLTRGHLKAGLDSVRGSKLRNFWTMLGVIIGVASVITIVGIGEGVKVQISNQIHHFGKNLITVRPSALHTGASSSGGSSLISGLGITSALTNKDVGTVSITKGVAASAPLTIVTGTAKGDNVYNGGFVIGTSPDLAALLNQSVNYGAFLTDEDEGQNAAVLGSHAAEKLFGEDVPLGRSFSFRGQDFMVRGIFNDFSSAPLTQDADFNSAIFIPNDVAQSLSKGTAPIYEILAKPSSSGQTAQVATAIQQRLDKAHGGQSNLDVLQGNQNLDDSNSILDLLTRLIAGVAAISLLVGGIGIMNVMLVSVAERMHEIGIRKAIGATNKQILSQFMIEAGMLSLGGGIIGIIVAFVVDLVLRLTTSLQPVISWQVVVLATGVSLAVGIIFGSIPALKAARRDPIDALRSE
ncbi:MAG TPA: ABC transporter permease [Candidatus Saccharimonadales bacterium]